MQRVAYATAPVKDIELERLVKRALPLLVVLTCLIERVYRMRT
jgi:hypothetical protein